MTINIILGAGFSAAITNFFFKKKSKVIGLHNFNRNNNNLFFRRSFLDTNKFFSKKVKSYGSLKFELASGQLHDRLTLGGNSTIWGGHINLEKIPNKTINLLKKKGKFVKLSFRLTGNIANNEYINQFQTFSGKIISSQNIIKRINDGFVKNFYIKNEKIYIVIIDSKSQKPKKIRVNKLFLCIGTIQLLDLLYRSNYLRENDVIEFTEFMHEYKFNHLFSKLPKKGMTVIRYRFSRAIGHYLGIQHYSEFLKLLNFIPFCIDQYFYKKKIKYKLQLKDNKFIEKGNKYKNKNFGQSIHYCDLKINKVSINNILRKIHPNIYGVGMSFVKQDIPGPISNDIILDAIKKIGKI